MRHLEVKRLWLQEETKRKHLTIEHIPGELKAADIFTKALLATRFYMLGSLLGLRVSEDEEKTVTMIEQFRPPVRLPRRTCSACMVLQVSDLGQAIWVCEHCEHVKTWREYLDEGEQPQPEARGSSWRSTPPWKIAGDIYTTDLLAAPIAEAVGELASNDNYDNGVELYAGQDHDASWMPGDFTAQQAAPSIGIMDCNSAYMHADQNVTDENFVHLSSDITYVR